jgi:hypothetical protein
MAIGWAMAIVAVDRLAPRRFLPVPIAPVVAH